MSTVQGCHNMKRNISHLTPAPVVLFAKAVGASAADLTALVGPGVTSLTYNAATGKVLVTLDCKYNSLLFLSGTVIDPGTPDDWEVTVDSQDVAGAKTISLSIWKGGALANLTTDETLMLMIVLSNSARNL